MVLGDFVYVIGGWNETKGIHRDVFFAAFTPEGPLGDWQPTTAPLPLKLQHHTVTIHKGAFYVMGGDNGYWDGSEVTDRILRAVPNEQGDITAWQDVGKLPEPLTIHAVTTLDNQLYVIGGSNTFRPDNTTVMDQVFTATINDDGSVGEFQPLASFPTTVGWVTATTVDNRIFAIAGTQQFRPSQLLDQVWAADILPDNTLSPFEPVNTITARQRHATVLVDRTLVAIAGGSSSGVLSRVDAATVDSDGNLGSWEELAPLPESRYAHGAFVHNGHIYVSGGFIKYGSNETSTTIFRLPWPQE
ncbi:4-oxalocrotonate tautomerase [Leptothoe kymatousa TAU-MAC 1615]|uniref:4-oxalocrotonate tautomerase n=1 Tax=Leptothoe kymatousa TAU-MAC 1615 TaxID=2364775 RepID=A0ABS5Y4N4_9CYAN|nr:4-oxalocrotonate tautomerase [Leptothoe kymatousa TAU-MAC 1615]